MPVIPTYQAKEDLNPDTRGMPRPTFTTAAADAEGDIAKATQGLGAQITAGADRLQAAQERYNEIQSKKAEFNTRLALDHLGAEIDKDDQTALDNMQPDGSGFAQGRTDNFIDKTAKFLQEKVPPQLRDEYVQRIQTLQEKKLSAYSNTEAKALNDFATKQLNSDLTASKSAIWNDPASRDERIRDMEERIDAAPISSAGKAELKQQARYALVKVAAQKIAPDDPQFTADVLKVDYKPPAKIDRAQERLDNKTGGPRADAQGTVAPIREAVLDRIGGVESGGNDNAQNPSSSAKGRFQFIDSTWLQYVKKYRPDIAAGKSDGAILGMRSDGALSREMAGKLLDDNAAALKAAGVPVTPGSLYLAHFAGPGDSRKGAIALLQADPSEPASSVFSPAAIAANRSILAGKTAGQVVAWAEKKMGGGAIDNAPAAQAIQVASRETGTLTDASPLPASRPGDNAPLVVADAAPRKKPAADPVYDILSLEDKLAIVKQAEIGQAQKLQLETQRATQEQALAVQQHKKEVDDLQYRAQDGKLTIEELDSLRPKFSSFEEYNSVKRLIAKADDDEVNNRAGIAKLATPNAIWTAEDKKLLSAMDLKAKVVDGIQRGDQAAADRVIMQFRQTGMLSPEVKNLFEGITRSGNPQQMQFAVSTLDRMERANPNAFEEAAGTKNRQLLTEWRSSIDSVGQKEFFERQKKSNDPAVLKANEVVEKEGRKVAEALDDKKILNAFTDHWYSSQPGKPMGPPDAPGMAQLKVEFANVFANEYRVADGNETLAMKNTMERLRQTWAVSPSSGNKLVKYAPELLLDKGFPRVAGSGDWLKDQVEAEVRRVGGEVPVLGTVPGVTRPTYALWATQDTQAEIDAVTHGRPLPDGRKSPQWTLVWEDPATGLKRVKPFTFNVDAAIAERQAHAAESEDAFRRDQQSPGADMERTRRTFEELRRRAGQSN